jgi:hypothetical protein
MMVVIKITTYIREDQVKKITEMGGTIADNIRRSLDEYIAKYYHVTTSRSSSADVSVSTKEGDDHG